MNGKAPADIFFQVQVQMKAFKELDQESLLAIARRIWMNGRATVFLNPERTQCVTFRYDAATGRVIRV